MIKKKTKIVVAVATLVLVSFLRSGQTEPIQAFEASKAETAKDAIEVLNTHCINCHGPDKPKGKVRFDTLGSLDEAERTDLLNRMHESIRFGEMPPEEAKQPSAAERKLLDDWIAQTLESAGSAKLEDTLKKPGYGNYVDHEDLFSGEYADLPGFTYDRRWLISEYIFDAKYQRILGGKTMGKRHGQRVPIVGSHEFRGFGVTNPFLLPTRTGVRYFADTDLTGGHLSSMLTNAQKTSEYITGYLVNRNSKYLPAINQIMALEDEHEATLAARQAFLENFIPKVCEEIYGIKNQAMLPTFVPVQLKPLPTLKEGEKYKKAPMHVAQNMLKGLGAQEFVYQALMDPEHKDKTNEAFKAWCERAWFYNGDHERKIQGRMAILREYLPEIRETMEQYARKIKPLVYKPLAGAEMQTIKATIQKHRQQGDYYNAVIEKCMGDWERGFKQARIDAGPPSDALLLDLIEQLFVQVLERSPESAEADEYLAVAKRYIDKLGNRKAIQKLIQTIILTSEFVYRQEFGTGEADSYGRRMLSPRDASYAIAYALTDQSPDEALAEAARTGRLNTREDYKREVTRILNRRDIYYQVDKVLADKSGGIQNNTDTAVRKLRFFREFFGYPNALTIFKDEKRFGGDRLGSATARLISEADRLVEHILEKDQNVFEELLTTEDFIVYHDGDHERMQARSDMIKRVYHHFKDEDWQSYKKEDLLKHADFLRTVDMRMVDPDKPDARNRQGDMVKLFKMSMRSIVDRLDDGQKEAAPFDLYRGYGNDFLPGYNVSKFWNYELGKWDYNTVQPAKVGNRKGMLTHPAWLIAHAQNTETDPVIRGKWVREKLLAGTIPDIPITVDAVIPENHNQTLRQRLASKTETDYCWRCHKHMNPLGYSFEAYDDFGRFRTEEPLEYPDKLVEKGPEQKGDHLVDTRDIYETLPVDASGYLTGTGDETLDGELADAMDLAERLGKSRRVRQSIIRHAFRYFMGRNETLSDSKTLIDAEQAYADNGGSFDAVIISLLTSDSFLYRKAIEGD